MGAGYYPLKGALARQLREHQMWNYEPDWCKKQSAIAIKLHPPISQALRRFTPALGRQGLFGTKGLLISCRGAVFTLATHPEVIARNTAV